MDNIKLEELEKACKKEKDHKVRTRMVAVRMVRVINTWTPHLHGAPPKGANLRGFALTM